MTAGKLSPKMKEALERMREHGSLQRWPGGYWTGADVAGIRGVPEWYFPTQTVMALLDRGLAVVTDTLPRGDASRVVPTSQQD